MLLSESLTRGRFDLLWGPENRALDPGKKGAIPRIGQCANGDCAEPRLCRPMTTAGRRPACQVAAKVLRLVYHPVIFDDKPDDEISEESNRQPN